MNNRYNRSIVSLSLGAHVSPLLSFVSKWSLPVSRERCVVERNIIRFGPISDCISETVRRRAKCSSICDSTALSHVPRNRSGYLWEFWPSTNFRVLQGRVPLVCCNLYIYVGMPPRPIYMPVCIITISLYIYYTRLVFVQCHSSFL